MTDNGHVKHYDTDWAKAKSRDLVGKMMDDTILTFRKPSQVKVLHFGGINLAEAKQIYLPRGILPQNIVSIEREKDIAQEQERLRLGIKVVHATLEDYIAQQREIDFDVVSLDYTGSIQRSQLKSLERIRAKQIKSCFIFHMCNLLKRDGVSNDLYVLGNANAPITAFDDTKEFNRVMFPKDVDVMVEGANRFVKKQKDGESCQSEKGLAYSSLIRQYLYGARMEGAEKLFNFAMGREVDKIKKLLLDNHAQMLDKKSEELTWDSANRIPIFTQFWVSSMYDVLGLKLKREGIPEDSHNIILMALADLVRDKFFIPKANVKYSYISESGAPMIGDVLFVRYPYARTQIALELGRSIGFPNEPEVKDRAVVNRTFKEYANAALKETSAEELRSLKKSEERFFLGNSSKPVLTKRRAIEELESGRDVEAIKAQYRGWEAKPLAAWAAHVKMGTYSSAKAIEENGDSTLEKLSKEDAIDLLSSGVPPQEVYSAWPTSFTLGQLRAYKAHVTQDTYKKNDSSNENKAGLQQIVK